MFINDPIFLFWIDKLRIGTYFYQLPVIIVLAITNGILGKL